MNTQHLIYFHNLKIFLFLMVLHNLLNLIPPIISYQLLFLLNLISSQNLLPFQNQLLSLTLLYSQNPILFPIQTLSRNLNSLRYLRFSPLLYHSHHHQNFDLEFHTQVQQYTILELEQETEIVKGPILVWLHFMFVLLY